MLHDTFKNYSCSFEPPKSHGFLIKTFNFPFSCHFIVFRCLIFLSNLFLPFIQPSSATFFPREASSMPFRPTLNLEQTTQVDQKSLPV